MKSKRTPLSIFRLLTLLLFAVALLCTGFGLVSASGLSQGYITTDTELKPGMVAALGPDSTSSNPTVMRGSSDHPDTIIGVATGTSDSLVVISPGKQQIYVQTSGNVQGYVSDINGAVKKGDLLTISPLQGIMMKADPTTSSILGTALQDLTNQNGQTYTVKSSSGTKTTYVAEIGVNLDHKSASGQTVQSTTLGAIGKAITGHQVSDIRVLIALVIFLLVLIAEGGIIYGAVSNAIAALGRNPMAHKVVNKELVRVLFIAVFVLSIGLGTIYAVMKL